MNTKSQFEVWGAPMITEGRDGAGSEVSDHGEQAQNARARRRRSMGTR